MPACCIFKRQKETIMNAQSIRGLKKHMYGSIPKGLFSKEQEAVVKVLIYDAVDRTVSAGRCNDGKTAKKR